MSMNKILIIVSLLIAFLTPYRVGAFEVAPKISDKEIVERLVGLEVGQENLGARIDAVDNRISDLRSDMNSRFSDLRSDMNGSFGMIELMLEIFITIALLIMGFLARLQWQMNKYQAVMEKSLETQKDELAFLKGLVEKLMVLKNT